MSPAVELSTRLAPERVRVRRRCEWSPEELERRLGALQPGAVFSIDRPITVEEFCDYVSDEWSAELVNGVVYIMSPPTDSHESVAGWLFRVLGQYVEMRGLGTVRGGRSGVSINTTNLREPDLLFFQTSRLVLMTPSGVHGAPDLAVEIVDSRKARRQAVEKQVQYEAIGVAEYWVIDLPQREVRQFVLEQGAFRRNPVPPLGELRSFTVSGFHLRTAWLFAGPNFPRSLDVVQALLAEAERMPV